MSLAEFKKLAKKGHYTNRNTFGGQIFGIWCDDSGGQRHLKAKPFGIEKDDELLIAVKNNNLFFIKLTKDDIDQANEAFREQGDLSGLQTFHLAKNASRTSGTQSYISIPEGNEQLWLDLCEFYNAKKEEGSQKIIASYSMNDSSPQIQSLLKRHHVVTLEQFMRILEDGE